MNTAKPKGRRWSICLYPLLFSVYPVLFLYARNTAETTPATAIKTGLYCLGAAFVLLAFASLALKNATKAAVAVSVLLLMFFGYGQVVTALSEHAGPGVRVGLLLWPLWALIIVVLLVVVARTTKSLQKPNQFLRALAVILTVLPSIQIASQQLSPSNILRQWDDYLISGSHAQDVLHIDPDKTPPDIYVFLLDAYSREDFLKERCGFDNSTFVNWLRSEGFYVADQARANYLLTEEAVPALLNMDYVHHVSGRLGDPVYTKPLQRAMFAKPTVVGMLRDVGYKLVEIPSHYNFCRIASCDICLESKRLGANDFEAALVASTMLRAFHKTSPMQSVVGVLDRIESAVKIEGPKLVFIHSVVAHSPFYVRADGSAAPVMTQHEAESLPEDEYNPMYVGAVEYLNRRLIETIPMILASSKEPPVIILLGDHGRRNCGGSPSPQDGVLAAFHLPGDNGTQLYPSISSVNVFRVLFNQYFGTNYPLLPDETYARKVFGEPSEYVLVD